MAVHVLGIRHHGPGSAKNVKAFMEELKPDIILIEGPPEADSILQWVDTVELKPPVAILCYQPDDPQRSVFYPFASFSPEWQAILYARQNSIHVRFCDLPISHQLAIEKEKRAGNEKDNEEVSEPVPLDTSIDDVPRIEKQIKADPIAYLSRSRRLC